MLITENRSMPRSHLQGSSFSRRNVHIYMHELRCTTHVHPCASKWRTVAFDPMNDAKFLWNSASFSENKDFEYQKNNNCTSKICQFSIFRNVKNLSTSNTLTFSHRYELTEINLINVN